MCVCVCARVCVGVCFVYVCLTLQTLRRKTTHRSFELIVDATYSVSLWFCNPRVSTCLASDSFDLDTIDIVARSVFVFRVLDRQLADLGVQAAEVLRVQPWTQDGSQHL